MINIKSQNNEYVKYALKSDISDLFWLAHEPIGWSNDNIQLTRNKDYHGIVTSFTGELSFYKETREYILNDFNALGINSNLKIYKYELEEINGVVKWDLKFTGIIDYSTLVDEVSYVKVRFNSNQLEELFKTRKDDEFELERSTSIDGRQIGKITTDLTQLAGVPLATTTKMDVIVKESHNEGPDFYWSRGGGDAQYLTLRENSFQSAVLEMLTDTDDRISTPDTANPDADPASKMFFVDSVDPNVDVDTLLKVRFSYKIKAEIWPRLLGIGARRASIFLHKYRYNQANLEYDIIESVELATIFTSNQREPISAEGEFYFENVAWNEGYAIGFSVLDQVATQTYYFDAKVTEFSINIASESNRLPSENVEFLFVHDALNRLSQIITNGDKRFSSRTFGRVENGYEADGKYGLIGLTSGYWIRQFAKNSPMYKSIKLSFEDIISSLNAVFNTGMGIEYIDGVQKIVVEDLKYFYQNKTVIILDDDVNEISYKVLKEDYFSSIEMGYEKGGDYNNAVGLDEPNVKVERITPINKNKQKYRKISKIRADDIGAEIIRRKPAALYPSEDTSQDDNVWFLDLKRKGDGTYIQSEWPDRLLLKPTGLSYANDFKSFLFTPLRMLFRHGWIIRAGMDQPVNLVKNITVNSSTASQSLIMHFKGDSKPRAESDDIPVGDLERPIILPVEVKFKYPVSNDLLRLITSKSVTDYEGSKISIPNYYFKFRWKNRSGSFEYGFLTDLDTNSNEFTFILANNNKI